VYYPCVFTGSFRERRLRQGPEFENRIRLGRLHDSRGRRRDETGERGGIQREGLKEGRQSRGLKGGNQEGLKRESNSRKGENWRYSTPDE